MTRMSLLDAMHAPVSVTEVDLHAGTIPTEEIDEILRLPMRRRQGDQARVELHRDRERGLWMWATWHEIEHRGGGRRVGPKWGRFAATRADALHCAKQELLTRIDGYHTPQAKRVRTWVEGLR